MNNSFDLYSQVQLLKPIPDQKFEKGDIATLVDIVNNESGDKGYVLEFFDHEGNTLDIAVVGEDFIGIFPKRGVFNVRDYENA